MICGNDNSHYAVIINDGGSGKIVDQNCTTSGQQLTVPGYAGSLVCADPSIICGQFDYKFLDTPTAGNILHASDNIWVLDKSTSGAFEWNMSWLLLAGISVLLV